MSSLAQTLANATSNKRGHDDYSVLCNCALFLGMLPNDCAALASRARVKVFARGEMLHRKGESVQQVFLLTSGCAKITQLGADGTEVILRLCVPGDVLGASALFSGGIHCTTAQACRFCRTLTWGARAFKPLVDGSPVFHQNMARILSQDLSELEERFREVATERVGSRVARQLARLHTKIGRHLKGEMNLSREELAQMTGTTLFTVSRLLSAWEANGIIKSTREAVTIRDLESLRSIIDSCRSE